MARATGYDYEKIFLYGGDESLYRLSSRHISILLTSLVDASERWNWPGVNDSEWDIASAEVSELQSRLVPAGGAMNYEMTFNPSTDTTIESGEGASSYIPWTTSFSSSDWSTLPGGRVSCANGGLFMLKWCIILGEDSQNSVGKIEFRVTDNPQVIGTMVSMPYARFSGEENTLAGHAVIYLESGNYNMNVKQFTGYDLTIKETAALDIIRIL